MLLLISAISSMNPIINILIIDPIQDFLKEIQEIFIFDL